MKTLDYVRKYKLNVSDKFDHSEFVEDLANDFIALLEMNKANDNLKGFDNALRCIKMKFDAINNKTVGCLTDKLWNYFYATVVVKLRDEMCPRDMEKKRAIDAAKKREYNQRKAYQAYEDQFFNAFFDRDFFNFLFVRKASLVPSASFETLELPLGATEDEIKSAYKKLAHIHHPDKGGKQEMFTEICDAKNKCLSWYTQQNPKPVEENA